MSNLKLIHIFVLLIFTTVGLKSWHYFGMDKVYALNDENIMNTRVLSDVDHGGKSKASLGRDGNSYILRCHIEKTYQWPFCEVSFQIATIEDAIDFSDYNNIELSIRSVGTGLQNIRFYLRHFEPSYTNPDEMTSFKINEVQFDTAKNQAPFTIPLNTFVVPSWWLHEMNLSPLEAATDLSNVVYLEVATGDFREAGDHIIYIDEIKLHGKWVTKENLLNIIILFWVAFAFLFLGKSFYQSKAELKKQNKLRDELLKINEALSIEKEELENISTRDSLTDVYNRYGLGRFLPSLAQGVKELNDSTSLIFLDIDHFKQVNDVHGHDVGDLVLQAFANLIKANKRDADILARWGGEEFVIFCPVTAESDGVDFAEKLKQKIGTANWPNQLKITSSFGVAQMSKDEEISDLIKRADLALYTAKKSGRNRVVPYTILQNIAIDDKA